MNLILRKNCVAAVACLTLLVLLLSLPTALMAQYQKTPPDFGDTYSFPSPVHPEPTANWQRGLDVFLLALGLSVAAWLVHKRRSRGGLTILSIASVAYFGFYRKGCICSVGAIQNVVLCLVDPRYFVSFSVIAIFFLPLAASLIWGRVFCSGVCPLGAIQDLVVVRPLRVPVRLDRALRWLQFVYLGLAVLFAGWGLNLQLGAWKVALGKRFLICDWDPFIPIFRQSGPFYMVAIGVVFLAAGMFIGRPYCRWLCPYGGILSLLSRVSWKNVRISPEKELDCGLCADACPYGAIRELRADRAFCMACSRCYESCPQQKKFLALRDGVKKPVQIKMPPRKWEAVARSWIGIVAILAMTISTTWVLATYVHARRVLHADKVLVETLKEQAKSDTEVQKVLQPELDRQHRGSAERRKVYSSGGIVLLISAGFLLAWLRWLRPRPGTGAGVPQKFLKYLEQSPKKPARIVRKKPNAGDSGS
jgi:ferredoxin